MTLALVEGMANQFAADHIVEYATELEALKVSPTRKEVNDSLWGTIGLTGVEVAVIDSPLMQRLRYIRQLGVAHWVYPGAVHTRFEHSLGVMHQVDRLAANINAIGREKGYDTLISVPKIQCLRLASLLHDVGHAAFSHVSETAVAGLPGVGQLSVEFSSAESVEERSLSEIFAYFVVRSDAARRLFKVLQAKYGGILSISGKGGEDALDETITFISSAIIGKKVDEKIPLLHELVSGPYDGDKLDYFIRDARFAGTPSVLDISRLLQKVTVRNIQTMDLPSDLARSLPERVDGHMIFGIKWSGVAVLDELHLARVLLYAKIYRHARIIGVEQMIKSFAEVIAKVASAEATVCFFYRHTDEAILAMDAGALSLALGRDPSSQPEAVGRHLDRAAKILGDIRRRKLTVKCFQLQHKYPADPREEVKEQEAGLIRFGDQMEHPVKAVALKDEILKTAEDAMLAVGFALPGGRDQLEASVAVHAVGKSKGGVKTARAYLLPPTGKPLAYRNYTMVNRGGWVESYLTDQPIGYVFCAEEIADYVYLAIEKMLRMSYDVLLPPSAMEAGKRDPKTLSMAKRSMAAGGFYKGCPFDLRPAPAALNLAYTAQVVRDFLPRMATYQPPAATGSARVVEARPRPDGAAARPARNPRRRDPDAGATAERTTKIERWLEQFETDDHVNAAVEILRQFRMLGRDDTVAALSGFIEGDDGFLGAVVVPFGSAPDSSAIQTYISGDLIGSHVRQCMNHQDLGSLDPSVPIIFVDDFIGSGRQAEDILGAAFAVQDLRRELNERRDPFDVAVQRRLKSGKVGFVFTAAWDVGLTAISNACSRVGIDATVHAHLRENDIPFIDNPAPSNDPKLAAFLDRCKAIGMQLATAEMGPQTKDRERKVLERGLGYGNRGMLLASPFNVPTQTLTAIWATGLVDGVMWEPLLPRRKKNLVADGTAPTS